MRFALALVLCGAAFAAESPVADAVERRDSATLQALLKQKADVNAPQGDGTTALHWAAFNDDLPSVRLLIAAGANVEATTRVGAITPLLMATRNGSVGVTSALLNAGADVNRANAEGTTPLMQAASSGSVETLKLLLDRHAVVDAKDRAHAQTALMFAASLNRAAAVKFLLAHGADPNLTTKLTKLEKMRVDIDGNPIPATGERPAARQAEKPAAPAPDPVATLTALVQKLTARVEELEKYPEARHAGEVVAVEAAPAAGTGRGGGRAGDVANLGPREVGTTIVGGMTALLFAARDGQFDAVRELVAGGANVNEVSTADKTSPLVMAIINGHLDIAKYLAEHGAGANVATAAGLTPLYAAIDVQWAPHAWFPQPNTTQEKVTYIDLIETLLAHNANPNARLGKKLWFRGLAQDPSWVDPAGSTAFWRAAQADDVAVMKLLVDAGAYPDAPSAAGETPLMVAAGIGWMANHTANSSEQWLAAVKYCVELGADVNAVDSRGYTALHGAAYIGDNAMVQYLVERGAKIDAVSKAGDTVADMANGPTRFGLPHAETVALLEKLGSKNNHNCRSDQCIPPPKEERAAPAAAPAKPAAVSEIPKK
jgi:ankyrin repeat protein